MSVFAVGVESKLNFSYHKSIKVVNIDPVALHKNAGRKKRAGG